MMEDGGNGHLGQAVEVIVRCLDLEVVTILLLQMEELTVLVNIWKINPALEEDVKLMEDGDIGAHGQHIMESIVGRKDLDFVTTQNQQMEVELVQERVMRTRYVILIQWLSPALSWWMLATGQLMSSKFWLLVEVVHR